MRHVGQLPHLSTLGNGQAGHRRALSTGTSVVTIEPLPMEKMVNALGKLEDVRLATEKLRDRLPEASRDRERADDVAEVFMLYSRTLLPYFEGAWTMTIKQRKLIKDLTRQVENTERLLLTLDFADNARNADLSAMKHGQIIAQSKKNPHQEKVSGPNEMIGIRGPKPGANRRKPER